MTPRERAEALGWMRHPEYPTWRDPGARLVVYRSVGGWQDAQPFWSSGRWHATEDAALAAALELRDVVLS